MRIGGVVDDEVDDDADAALPAAMGELDKVAERAVARIDAVIVRDVVAVVLAGRRLERHQPDRGDAEALQIIQPAQQALEIADAVAVGVHIGADGETIEYAVLVPEVVDHAEAASFGPRRSERQDISGENSSGSLSGGRDRQNPVSTCSAALMLAAMESAPAMSAWCHRRTAASRRRRWRSRAARRGCCGHWGFPASANCRCRRDGAPIWWR